MTAPVAARPRCEAIVGLRRRFGRDRSALETAADHEYAGRYWAASAAGRR